MAITHLSPGNVIGTGNVRFTPKAVIRPISPMPALRQKRPFIPVLSNVRFTPCVGRLTAHDLWHARHSHLQNASCRSARLDYGCRTPLTPIQNSKI